MTNRILTSLCILFLSIQLVAQSETNSPSGLPGDGFSLEGALALFKSADSPEDFEKKLNKEDNYVNNLDLNEDGQIDFIRVEDHMEDDVHAIVLQVALNQKEVQDIAVIELEKTGAEEATLQIVGDEDLYGEQVIVEPTEMSAQSLGKGPNADLEITRVIVNVWAWPSVRYVYRPSYRVYVSPYRWGVRINWWKPWRPRTWVACNNYRTRYYRPHYRVVHTHRVVRARHIYQPHRRTTTVVRTRTVSTVGVKKHNSRSVVGKKTTTVKAGKVNGNPTVGKKTTTTVVGKKANGTVGARKTTTVKKASPKRKGVQKKTTTTKVKKTPRGKVGKKTTTRRRG